MRLVLPPTIWLAHFSSVYVLLSLFCASDAAKLTLMGMNAFMLGVGVATVLALGGIGVAASRALRDRRGPRGAEGFSAQASALLAILSAIAVLWVAYPAFVLPACAS